MLKNKDLLTEMKHKILDIKHHIPHLHKTNVNARRQNKCRVDKENQNWKEDDITISQEPKLEKSCGQNRKNKQFITEYLTGKHQRTKRTNLC